MLTRVFPTADTLPMTLLYRRRKGEVPFLIILLLAIASRRGRSTLSYTLRKLAAPLHFLIWCVGRKRRRRGRCTDGNGAAEMEHAKGAAGEGMPWGGAAWQLARLGDSGRLAAFGNLRELQQEGACCDITLAVGGQLFKAHKCVLAAQSFPFRAMFDGAFKEGSERVVALGDVEPSAFALLLDFLYDRSINIDADNVEALLELSSRYSVSLLRRHCCAYMARSANPSNACSLLAVADRFDCHRLRRELLAFVLECFPIAWCESGSGGLRQLPLALLAEVLRDDRLVTGEEGEVLVFRAAVSWLEIETSRERESDQVLSHVRFGLIPAKTLASEVEVHPFVQTKAGRSFVHEAYRYQALPLESREKFAASMKARATARAPHARDSSRKSLRWVGDTRSSLDRELEALPTDEGPMSDDDERGDHAVPHDGSAVGTVACVAKCRDTSAVESCHELVDNVQKSVEKWNDSSSTSGSKGRTSDRRAMVGDDSGGWSEREADMSSSPARMPGDTGLRTYV